MSASALGGGGGGSAPRCVVHIDCDAFYAQVEYRRLGISRDAPLAVNQWGGLIAVGYPARAFGVKRGDRVDVAKQKCPQLVCVHVETIDEKGRSADDGDNHEDEQQQQQQQPQQHDRSSQKACLDRYREASEEVMAVIGRFAAQVEKASIDEVYLDLTPEVQRLAAKATAADHQQHGDDGGDDARRPFSAEELVGINGQPIDPNSPWDRFLLLGARVVARLRRAVLEETGFTVSAGIAHNKMLAKLCSARHKPNKQTVVPTGAVAAFMAGIPIKEMRGLGGKLGDAVLAFLGGGDAGGSSSSTTTAVHTAADLLRFGEAELRQRFGPKEGAWLHRFCRGVDDEAVVAKTQAQSLQSFKSFDPVGTAEGVRGWLQVLAADLKARLDKEFAAHRRRATVLSLVYRGARRQDHKQKWVAGQTGELTPTVSRNMPMPAAGIGGGREVVPSEAALVAAGMALFTRLGGPAALPCTRLGLGATGFVDQPSTSILTFFGTKKAPTGTAATAAAAVAAAAPEAAAAAPVSSSSSLPQAKEEEEEEEAITVVEAESDGGGAGKRCGKCGQAVGAAEWAEHADWHVAVELQKAYGGLDPPAAATAATSTSSSASGGGGGQKRPAAASSSSGSGGGGGSRGGKSAKSSSSNNKTQTLDKFWGKKK